MNQTAVMTIEDHDVKAMKDLHQAAIKSMQSVSFEQTAKIILDSIHPELVRQHQRGRFLHQHKGKLKRRGMRVIDPWPKQSKKIKVTDIRVGNGPSQFKICNSTLSGVIPDGGLAVQLTTMLPQQEINKRLYQFNLTNDWSVFDDVPPIQHVSVMYPHVPAKLGETRQAYEARLKEMFKIQD